MTISQNHMLLDKFIVKDTPKVIEAKEALSKLEKSLETLIKQLQPKDFDVFIELLFSQSGWLLVTRHLEG